MIREMLSKVEEEQLVKLEQLNSIKVQQDNLFPGPTKSSSTPSFDGLTLNSGASSTTNNSAKTGSLSLEDKERMVREQEQAERLSAQAQLVPQRATPTEKPKPKDLTSTLIGNNLASLSLANQASVSKPSVPTYNLNSFQPTAGYQIPPLTAASSHQFANPSTLYHQPQQQSVSIAPTKPDLSAFDRLTHPDLKPKQGSNQPIGLMSGTTAWSPATVVNNGFAPFQSHHQQSSVNQLALGGAGNTASFNQASFANFNNQFSNNGKQQQTKQLSKSDMDDLLN